MTEPAFTYGGPKAVPSPGAGKILDRIKARTVATVSAETKAFPVDQREGFAVAYSTYLPGEDYELLTSAHGGDKYRLAKAILAKQCRSVLVDGEPWVGDDNAPVTFTHPDCWAMFEVENAFEAIKAMYLIDPDVLRTADAVLVAAGWDLTRRVDPTQP